MRFKTDSTTEGGGNSGVDGEATRGDNGSQRYG